MQTHELILHAAHPARSVTSITAKIVSLDRNWLQIRWRVEGSAHLNLSPPAGKGRADDLWKRTCFELFLKPEDGEDYCEFNLSPSEQWAAYDFGGYRDGMRNRTMPRDPVCTMRPGATFAIFDAAIPRAALPDTRSAMGLSAVIEEEGGVKSFWALAHPDDHPPDFHHPACFAATLDPRTSP